MFRPLNALLYERLRRAFGPVKVSNPGVRMKVLTYPDLFDGRRMRHQFVEDGEYYRVNCFACGDTKFRLNISHMYGKPDSLGRPMRFLAICFNEACLGNDDNREELYEILSVLDGDLEDAKVLPGRDLDPSRLVARLPGPCKRLDLLPPGHHARRYVEARRFDPDRLARFYGLSYCQDSMIYLARHRLVMPIYWRGKLAGWQCRYIGELPWKDPARKRELPPKYYTAPSFPRGNILANLDIARRYHTGVLVEGWFDVYGLGPMAMPVLGNTVSEYQRRDFAAVFRSRAGVLLLDPEEFESESSQRVVRDLRKRMMGRFAAVKLPPGKDPGSLDRTFLRDFVREQALEQGVRVSWEKA